jgi:aminoglycoside phosphotransferase (APT) family kinase protein
VGRGRPGHGYPFDWSIYRWIEGELLATAALERSTELARQLAGFLKALQSCPADEGPPPGADNFHRGGSLTAYDEEMQSALGRLGADLQAPLRRIWQDALAAEPRGAAVWVHGDFAPRNLLVRDGDLAGVIDFGQVAVGDPACDLAIAWTYLREPARYAFREGVGADPATWSRARGWVAWKAAILLSGVVAGPQADIDAAAATLQALLTDS